MPKQPKKEFNEFSDLILSRSEQLAMDLFQAERCYALYWAQKKFHWTPKAFYQKLLLGCLDRVYRYPMDYPQKHLRGEIVNRFAWRIGRQCIPEGTIIHSRDGKLMPIEEHPDAFPTQKNATIYNIEVDGGYTIRCTGNHPISVRGKTLEFMNAETLKVGDELEVLTEFDRWGDGKVPYSFERYLSSGVKKDGTKWSKTEQVSGVYEINNELAELLGLMVSDSNCYTTGLKKTLYFTNSNMTYLNRVEELVKRHFPTIQVTWYKKKPVVKKNGDGDQKEAYDLMLAPTEKGSAARGKNPLKDFLLAMNPHKSGFPRAVAECFTKDQVIHFLRGSWMGDGNFYVTSRYQNSFTYESTYACSLNRTYAEYYRELFQKLGISMKLVSQTGKLATAPFFLLKAKNRETLLKFNEILGSIPDKEIPEDAFNEQRKVFIRGSTEHSFDDGENTGFRTIKKITIEEQKVDCWDVEIEGKGWFICSSIRVKNSGKTECLAIAALYMAVCKPVKFHKSYGVRRKSAITAENPTGQVKVVEDFTRGANIIMASADADKAKVIFDRVLSFLNASPEYQIAMDSGVIKVGKHPFPTIIINADGWVKPATVTFRGPGAGGQAARSHTYDYKLYDEADYMPEAFFEAELATEINAKTASGKDNSFVILSSTPSGRRAHFYRACFGHEALVAMADGSLRKIQSIELGEEVLNRFGKPEKVTENIQRDYVGDIVRMRVAGFEHVRVTPNHRVMAIKSNSRYCNGCKSAVWTNRSVCVLHGMHSKVKPPVPEYHEIGDLDAGDFIAIPRAFADTYFKNDYVPGTKQKLINSFKNDDFLFMPILQYDILKNQKIVVYNLTVENDHSYTVNGIGVANCTDPKMGFKEFHFPSWENPNYDEKMDRKSQATLSRTAYEHEIMANWGTVEMGVFDWTYFHKVFSYEYKNSAKREKYEYRNVKLSPDDIRKIGMNNLSRWLLVRFVPRNPLAKYWFGADLGYSADPSEFVVFEEFNGVMKMVQRIHMEHLTYDIQADLIALMDTYFQFQMLGMDAGNNGTAVAQMLQSKRTGWNKFASHNFERRLLPIPFGGRLQIDKINGKEITEPAKQAMTNMIIAHAEQKLLIMPGLDYDPDFENQFRNHTYSVGLAGGIVYSKGTVSADHIIDAVRTAFYAKAAANFTTKKRLPGSSMFKQPKAW